MAKHIKSIAKWGMLVLAPLLTFNITLFAASGREDKAVVEAPSAELTSNESAAETKIYNILILGEDEAAGLTDALIIVSCDTKSKSVNLLQIPRDTYAEYTSAAYRKINAARDVLGGGRAVADFISENLCIPIDYYIAFGLDAVEKVVDALGGVEVDVPTDMIYTDPYQNLEIEIKKGIQTLDGEKAGQFIRYRNGYIRGDLDRLDAQKLFLAALLQKLSEQTNLFSVAEIIGAILPYIETDISYSDCFEIIKAMGVPDMNCVYFATLPGGDIQSISGAWYYVMNRAAAYRIIKERFAPELSEAHFDKNRKFTSTVRNGFGEIYNAERGYEPRIYSAAEMNGG